MQEISNSLAFGRTLPLANRGLRTQRGLLSGVGATLSLLGQAVAAIRRNGGTLIGIPDNFAGTYIDSTGTTPVTAVGDLVGKLNSQTNSNHATQPTTASKPVVTRVPKRLGPNLAVNGTFDSGTTGWSANNGGAISVSGGELTVTNSIASSGRGYQMVPTEVNKPYLITSFARAGTASAIVGWGTLAGSSAGGSVLTSSAQPLQLAFVATAASTSVTLQTNIATAGHTASFDNVAVQEVLEWTNAISFDGSNDFLQTGITTGNEGWICAGVQFGGAAGAIETVFCSGAVSDAQKGVWLFRNGGLGNVLQLTIGNGTGRTFLTTDVGGTLLGSRRVVEAGWSPLTAFKAVDGVEASSVRTGDASPSPTTAVIGASTTATVPLNGPMTAIIYTLVLPSAADRALIRKWVGSLQGQTL